LDNNGTTVLRPANPRGKKGHWEFFLDDIKIHEVDMDYDYLADAYDSAVGGFLFNSSKVYLTNLQISHNNVVLSPD